MRNIHRQSPAEPSEGLSNRFISQAGASAAPEATNGPSSLSETVGSVFGASGAFLLAMPVHPAWGFGAFLVSNVCLLIFGAACGHRRFFLMQLVFLVTSLLGLWNWWLGPLLLNKGG